MGWYVVRRVAAMIPVFLGATLLIYCPATRSPHWAAIAH
jgi:hypothetical protein